MIAVIDYGAGNLFSLGNALEFLGLEFKVTSDKHEIDLCDSIILPGVGAFPDAMHMLQKSELTEFLKSQAVAKPFLGICLGAQVLFEKGYEHTETKGLSLIDGFVRKIEAPGLKIPHMGWNSLEITSGSPITENVPNNSFAYFVHSYKIETPDVNIASYCEYGEKIPAVVQKGRIYGAQFHPEKSGAAGLKMLENFGRLK